MKRLVAVAAFLALGLVSVLETPARAGVPAAPAAAGEHGEAIFAGGCFWCMEVAFKGQPGVISVTSGYSGGRVKHPSYEEVSTGDTGHVESVRVLFDPAKVSYAKLLDIFWHNVDPTSEDGQFCDRGSQYRAAIFWFDESQHKQAVASQKAIEAELKTKVATVIAKAGDFWPAEEHHQEFYKKQPEHYQAYRTGCGRDRRLHQIWGDKAPAAH